MKPSTIGTITAAAALAVALPLAAQAGVDRGPAAPESASVLQEQDHTRFMDQMHDRFMHQMHDTTRGDHMTDNPTMTDQTMDTDHDQFMHQMHNDAGDGDRMGARPLGPGGSMRG